MPATLLEFARANDAAASTTKKLQKQSILSEYFRTLRDDDLRLAVRYTAGRNFASTDGRVLNIGWSQVSQVILSMFDLDPHEYHALVVKSGEIGEALSQIWPSRIDRRGATDAGHEQGHFSPADADAVSIAGPLTLQDITEQFDRLAATGVGERKRAILLELFSRCQQPREAAYLAKIIFREMRSGAREGVLQAALAHAFDKPLASIQRCQLLVGDLDEVAVLARNDALAAAAFRLFHPIQFMLATPQETPEAAATMLEGRSFIAEDKLDGIRAQVHKSGHRVAIYTRTMDRTEESFPEVVAAVRTLPGEFLLDGEIVPYRDGQVLPFAHIQRRLGRKALSAQMLRENPTQFIAFDVLYRDGQLLLDCPLKDRKAALEALSGSGQLLTSRMTPVTTPDDISRTFDEARARRNEGIMLKDPESLYSPGRRGQWWLKLKTHLPTIDCVVTAAEHGHGKRRDVLSDYTFAVWEGEPDQPGATLVNVGKAYSGVTDEEIAQLTELFLKIAQGRRGRVYAVEPRVVLEIACDQIQKSDRHASGYALRFPRIKRIRWDKRPEDADRLGRVIEIYESSTNFARPTKSADLPAPEPTLFD